MMLVYTLKNGDELYKYQKSLVLCFKGKRKVLSTGPHNGGYRENLKAVFNNDGKPALGMACTLKAPTYEEHMKILSEELGLEPENTSGISTAAFMENVAVKEESFGGVTVTAIVTGGIETNGGRVGDPASWVEVEGKAEEVKHGTINIILHIDGDLTEGTVARALVTCTEAKTAAIQELLAPSRYSMGIATGSGTDGTIIISDGDSKLKYTNAGKHSKLGELIGKAVKSAVKEALNKQSGLCPKRQHNIIRRMDRFGITEESLWNSYHKNGGKLIKPVFIDKLEHLSSENDLVTYTSLYAHLLDQFIWDLLSAKEVLKAGYMLLETMQSKKSLVSDKIPQNKDEVISVMIENYQNFITDLLLEKY